jgi:hypothetical protein
MFNNLQKLGKMTASKVYDRVEMKRIDPLQTIALTFHSIKKVPHRRMNERLGAKFNSAESLNFRNRPTRPKFRIITNQENKFLNSDEIFNLPQITFHGKL